MTILEHLETELGRDVLGWSSYLRYKLVRCLAGILQHDSMEAKTFGMTFGMTSRIYDVYAVSFRFRMSAECNVDFWNGDHMARSLTCLRYSQSGKMAKLHQSMLSGLC